MKRIYLIIIILTFSFSLQASDITREFSELEASYAKEMSLENYSSAIEIALKLNAIDPSNTNTLLYIIFSSVKAGKQFPSWILKEPWPNVTSQDIINRKLAEALVSGT